MKLGVGSGSYPQWKSTWKVGSGKKYYKRGVTARKSGLCVQCTEPQSRQSAKLFLQSPELRLPNPSPAGECPPPPRSGGRGTLSCTRGGWGVPSDRYCGTLGIYSYVLCMGKTNGTAQLHSVVWDYFYPPGEEISSKPLEHHSYGLVYAVRVSNYLSWGSQGGRVQCLESCLPGQNRLYNVITF